MVKPKSNKIIHAFFSWYISKIIKSDFEDFEHNEIHFSKNRAILLLSNHFSWWDGFLLFHLNKIYFKKNFHVMILEQTAKEVKFLKYLGAFSVNKSSRSVMTSLDYAGKLLNDPANLVLIFPQGKLHSSSVKEITFEKGLNKIISASQKKFQFVFAAILTDYFDKRKPRANIYLKDFNNEDIAGFQELTLAYNQHYQQAVNKQAEKSI